MDRLSVSEAGSLCEWLSSLDGCDGYVVLVVDPETSESDAYGPYDGMQATRIADRLRREFVDSALSDVEVEVIRWHRPAPVPPTREGALPGTASD